MTQDRGEVACPRCRDGAPCMEREELERQLAQHTSLLSRLQEAERERDEAQMALDETMYCPKCGSCGIPDCCGFRCMYLQDHRAEFEEMRSALDGYGFAICKTHGKGPHYAGFCFACVEVAEQQAREGNTVPAGEFFAELRAKYAARSALTESRED